MNNNAGIITMAKELIMKVGSIGKNRLAWHVSRTRFITFQNLSAKRENFLLDSYMLTGLSKSFGSTECNSV